MQKITFFIEQIKKYRKCPARGLYVAAVSRHAGHCLIFGQYSTEEAQGANSLLITFQMSDIIY